MTYTKLVNGEPVPMTASEISQRQAEEAAWEAGRAMREWKESISKTDAKIPRALEDVIDALDAGTKAKITKETMDAYTEKKTVRSQRP
jgi:polyhydroxyalkanoate synthesis regulator phasin